jgi:uncharacterized protein YxjI
MPAGRRCGRLSGGTRPRIAVGRVERKRDMGLLHRHDREPEGRTFQMRQKLLSIGDDYWIEDERGQRVYRVDGKALRVRDTWILEDTSGTEVAEIRERKIALRDKMSIKMGDKSATVTKRAIGIRDHFKVEVDGGDDLKVHGNILDHEYDIERDGDKVAEVSKKWFRVRDSYGVEVRPGQDPVLMLAITVAVDGMTRDVG